MMVGDVVRGPHPGMGRHSHHELAGGLELGGDGGERRSVVVDMLDDVERADQIVIVGYLVELGQRRTHDLPAKPFFRKRRGLLV